MNSSVSLRIVVIGILASGCSNAATTTTPPSEPIPVNRLRADPYSFTFNGAK